MKWRCYYCDGDTNHREQINNSKRSVCDSVECQYKFQEDKDKQKERNRNYDNWRLRSE